jgi:hypothetical protein
VVGAWQKLICPVLITIGERPAATGELIEVEHLLSRTVPEALAAVARPGPGVPARILLTCADEEQHSLPLEAMAAAERGAGEPTCRRAHAQETSQVSVVTASRARTWTSTSMASDPGRVRSRRATAVPVR